MVEAMDTLAEINARAKRAEAARDVTRAAFLMLKNPGNKAAALREAPRFYEASPRFELFMKGAIEAGGAGSGQWGSETANFARAARDFVALVDDSTVVGQLGLLRTPFMTPVIVESSAPAAGFVGAGAGVPFASVPSTATTPLEREKVAVIVPFTDESVRTWSPAAAGFIESRMRAAVRRGIDSEFLDPDVAAGAGVQPGSVLNGVDPLGLFGATAATALSSFETLLDALDANGCDLANVRIVMTPTLAVRLALLQNSGNGPVFPTLGARGGSVAGVPVLTTPSAARSGSPSEKLVAAVDVSRVLLADDGEVAIDTSRAASVQMDSAPGQSSLTPTATVLTSAFQTNTVLLKIVRWVNWSRVDSGAVAWMTSAQ
jgi:HK97 family phage major capsid protein